MPRFHSLKGNCRLLRGLCGLTMRETNDAAEELALKVRKNEAELRALRDELARMNRSLSWLLRQFEKIAHLSGLRLIRRVLSQRKVAARGLQIAPLDLYAGYGQRVKA